VTGLESRMPRRTTLSEPRFTAKNYVLTIASRRALELNTSASLFALRRGPRDAEAAVSSAV
jgi:hypothetical protein